jgi:nanoRNase/pAp phosphatase (c-di-AMP/oligoRNAs hydrolase)
MSTFEKQYRLVTRSDFDGLVAAVLLKKMAMINEIKFVHPKDVQDGKVALTDQDITTNLPYSPNVHMAFDHHSSEDLRVGGTRPNYVNNAAAPSAARVVYEYFGGAKNFPDVSPELIAAADKADSAHYTMDDVLNPQGWDLIAFITDPRTGLGRFKEFGISNYALMMEMISYYESLTLEKILSLDSVKERIDLYREHEQLFKEQLQRCGKVEQNLLVLDLRSEETIYVGNRFMLYALFPQCNISMHVLWGLNRQNVVFAVGKSIFKRDSRTNIGEIMLAHGGGGHVNAGTCQIEIAQAEEVKQELIRRINADELGS